MNNKQGEWWESDGGFFGDGYMEADNSLEGYLNDPATLSDRTKREVDGVVKLCSIPDKGSVMDCPSGYGRHSLALAQRGYQVTGVDINERFLEISRSQQERLGVKNAKFIHGDMRKLSFDAEFNAIINMFYAFGFFEDEKDDILSLENFHKALKPGGKFLMQTHITLPRFKNGDIKLHEIRPLKSGNKLELFRRYDPKTKREFGEWSVLKVDGTKEELTPYSMRIYTAEEFADICKKAGFSSVKNYGGWDGAPYKDESPELLAVATK